MTKFFKCFLSAILIFSVLMFSATSVLSETVAKDSANSLSVTLPENYLLLNADTAEENVELIESLGYSLASFKTYLKPNENGAIQTLFLGVEPSSKAQIAVKCWSSDFSKKIGNFVSLNEEALSQTAKQLVTVKGASYKTVSANGMTLIEIRLNGEDSGGKFCSIQYLTVCNGKFYSLNFSFSGAVNNQKAALAWDTLATFKIKNKVGKGVWDAGSIFIIILLSLAIIGAVIMAIILVYSIVRDIKKRRTDPNENDNFIERRRS